MPKGRLEDKWFPRIQDWQNFDEDYEPAGSEKNAVPKVGPQTLQHCAQLPEWRSGSPILSVCTLTFWSLPQPEKRRTGRPLTYTGDPNAPHLSEAARRWISLLAIPTKTAVIQSPSVKEKLECQRYVHNG